MLMPSAADGFIISFSPEDGYIFIYYHSAGSIASALTPIGQDEHAATRLRAAAAASAAELGRCSPSLITQEAPRLHSTPLSTRAHA